MSTDVVNWRYLREEGREVVQQEEKRGRPGRPEGRTATVLGGSGTNVVKLQLHPRTPYLDGCGGVWGGVGVGIWLWGRVGWSGR